MINWFDIKSFIYIVENLEKEVDYIIIDIKEI